MHSHPSEASLSLFDGTAALAVNFLGITSIRHWSAVLRLDGAPPAKFSGPALVEGLFAQVEANWSRCLAAVERPPSLQNWRWFDPKEKISLRNDSPEVMLERAAVAAAVAQGRRDWSNQIPIASGLILGPGDRRRAIDLVHLREAEKFDFVELKVGSDNPLFAAVEILQYGFVWLLSKRNHEVLGYSEKALIRASDVRLSVLAPAAYYRNLDLSWLAIGLSNGLQALGERDGVRLRFAFEEFPSEFRWPGSDPAAVLSALDSRQER